MVALKSPLNYLLLLMLSLLITACSSTSLNKKHELFAQDPDIAAAQVYFIRPDTYRERGLADNPVAIEANGKHLMDLAKGEYTYVRMKPVKVTFTTRSLTLFTNKMEPVEMTRTSEITLQPNERYFLHVKQVNEEFRGVYYLIDMVSLETAKSLIDGLRTSSVPGSLAIDKL
jgi:hypothetical protein